MNSESRFTPFGRRAIAPRILSRSRRFHARQRSNERAKIPRSVTEAHAGHTRGFEEPGREASTRRRCQSRSTASRQSAGGFAELDARPARGDSFRVDGTAVSRPLNFCTSALSMPRSPPVARSRCSRASATTITPREPASWSARATFPSCRHWRAAFDADAPVRSSLVGVVVTALHHHEDRFRHGSGCLRYSTAGTFSRCSFRHP